MRKFRSVGDSLRDTRTAHTFLLALAFISFIMGLLLTHFDKTVNEKALADSYRSLTLCSDALTAWESAASDDERYAASVRFETAVSTLPSEVTLEPLLSLAADMRNGGADITRVHALADTFALLSAVDFADEAEARTTVAQTLDGVNSVIVPETDAEAVSLPPEVLSYTRKVAEKSVRGILDGREGTLTPELSEDGATWTVLADNVRMSFDAETGSLEGFVFLRLGSAPNGQLSDEERLEAAREFYCTNRRRDGDVSVTASGEVCGFLCTEIADGEDVYRVNVDSHGRIWSVVKVKR